MLAAGWIYVSRRHRLSIDVLLPARLVAGYLAAVLAHEAGHALAAVTAGFRITGFAIWPFRFYRHSIAWHVAWHGGGGPSSPWWKSKCDIITRLSH